MSAGDMTNAELVEVRRDERQSAPAWNGPQCQMCNGTGTARMTSGDGKPYYVRCPACNGHGRDPS
jgi:DnaJ-class molecular chaperone